MDSFYQVHTNSAVIIVTKLLKCRSFSSYGGFGNYEIASGALSPLGRSKADHDLHVARLNQVGVQSNL